VKSRESYERIMKARGWKREKEAENLIYRMENIGYQMKEERNNEEKSNGISRR